MVKILDLNLLVLDYPLKHLYGCSGLCVAVAVNVLHVNLYSIKRGVMAENGNAVLC